MKNLLIISPHFPPSNAPDMHRIRMSLAHYEEFNWKPHILSVNQKYVDIVKDRFLTKSLPNEIKINYTNALPLSLTRIVGFSNLGIRAIIFLYFEGRKILKNENIDLIFFSTTQFMTLVLGRLWKKEFGIPYVIDMQDPWVGDYYEKHVEKEKPSKYKLARIVHKRLEPFTMNKVDGILSVTQNYIDTLCERYKNLNKSNCVTIPFGYSESDFSILEEIDVKNDHFKNQYKFAIGAYVGVLGKVMEETCKFLCMALEKGINVDPDFFSKLKLFFIGTDYATGTKSKKTIEPIAKEMGVDQLIEEDAERVPYFKMLKILKDSDFLIIVGSDDPSYSASKIYPYIFAKKPILAIFHEKSSAVELLKSANSVFLTTFNDQDDSLYISQSIFENLKMLLSILPFAPNPDLGELKKYSSLELTKRQCSFFDKILLSDKKA